MPKNDKEMLENLRARIKKQNEKAKENWDTVSCRLPKGTKERIKALGLTINGVINESVLAYLDCMEEEQKDTEPDQPDPEPEKPVKKVLTEEENRKNLLEWQALLDEKKAVQERIKAEREAEKEEKRKESIAISKNKEMQ